MTDVAADPWVFPSQWQEELDAYAAQVPVLPPVPELGANGEMPPGGFANSGVSKVGPGPFDAETLPPIAPPEPAPAMPPIAHDPNALFPPAVELPPLDQPAAPDAISSAAPLDRKVSDLVDVSRSEPANYTPTDAAADREKSEYERVLQMDPAQFAVYVAQRDEAQRAELSRRMAEATKVDNEAARNTAESERRALEQAEADNAQVRADAARLANERTRPDGGFWETRSTMQKVASFVAIIAGGFDQRNKGPGARNVGLDMINGAIEQHIAADRADFQHRMSALDRKRGAANDAQAIARERARYEDTQRLALNEQAKQQIVSDMQRFDPAGTRAIRMRDMLGQLDARQAQIIEARRKAVIDEELKLADLRNKDLDAAKKRRELSRVGGAGAGTQKYAPDQLATMHPGAPVPPIPMDLKEYGQWLGRTKEAGEITTKANEPARFAAENARKYGVAGVIKKDGTPYQGRDEKQAADLTHKINTARQVVAGIDRLLSIRDRVGGESGIWNSDESRQINVIQSNLRLLKKAGTQGMSSDRDFDVIGDALGGDASSWRARKAGLEEARALTIAAIRGEADSVDAKLVDDKWTNVYEGEATKTDADKSLDDLLKSAPEAWDARKDNMLDLKREFGFDADDATALEARRGKGSSWYAHEPAYAAAGGMFPSQRKALDDLVAATRGTDAKQRDSAMERIAKLAEDARDPSIRAFAKRALEGVVTPPPLADERPRAVGAKETAP
jgi:hypothetical protein